MKNPIKISFKLSEEELGPFPVSSENLWCRVEDGYYKIRNIPMFVSGIAYNDLVDIKEVGDNKYQVSEMIESSGNSTIWMQVNIDANPIIDNLKFLKCQIEGGAFKELFAINVPESIEWEPIGRYLDSLEENDDIVTLYSSFNHEDY